jgi:hypothetical protein
MSAGIERTSPTEPFSPPGSCFKVDIRGKRNGLTRGRKPMPTTPTAKSGRRRVFGTPGPLLIYPCPILRSSPLRSAHEIDDQHDEKDDHKYADKSVPGSSDGKQLSSFVGISCISVRGGRGRRQSLPRPSARGHTRSARLPSLVRRLESRCGQATRGLTYPLQVTLARCARDTTVGCRTSHRLRQTRPAY